MGFLHEGHLSLVRAIRSSCDAVVVTIFVNPTQFNQQEDLEKYPRDEERDISLLEADGVDAVFLPSVDELYPPGVAVWVAVEGLVDSMEGAFRPGHFRGVTTIVAKLFNLIEPDMAIFGEKDFQQLRVIEEMTRGLLKPISIIRGALIREEDGIAMSSRNVRLSAADRVSARAISRALRAANSLFLKGETDAAVLRESIIANLSNDKAVEIEYVELVDETTLKPVARISQGVRVCVAAWVGGVRLIDTIGFNAVTQS
jgi:pantoate--beta-alanine ligase